MLVEIMFLEVDLDYPDDLHNLHNDYLLELKNYSHKRNFVWISVRNDRRKYFFLGKNEKSPL